ncbi:uncharacterized protein A4U43_UnF5640 [Asparagus officinalis]|uniref:Uncharacterized protein n=1 Tax=Asparagus officinalis TaxID=4686 RepID=A0A1R3L6N6_ASPOF|nr:uncharacterized protein A4U43_UnF5640 [Asparagus officinalis]
MAHVRASFLKLQEELATQKTDLENALQSLMTKENELVNWHREMEECARSNCLTVENMKLDLKEYREPSYL